MGPPEGHAVDPPVSWGRLRRWLERELEVLAEPVTFGSLGKVFGAAMRQRAGGLSEMDAIANAVEITFLHARRKSRDGQRLIPYPGRASSADQFTSWRARSCTTSPCSSECLLHDRLPGPPRLKCNHSAAMANLLMY